MLYTCGEAVIVQAMMQPILFETTEALIAETGQLLRRTLAGPGIATDPKWSDPFPSR